MVFGLDHFVQAHHFGMVDAVQHLDLVLDDRLPCVRAHLLLLVRLQGVLLARIDVDGYVHHSVGAFAQAHTDLIVEQPPSFVNLCLVIFAVLLFLW